MKFYQYILFIFLILFVARIYWLFFRNPSKESFESLTNCLEQGYPDDFCMRVPLEACVSNCPLSTIIPKKFNVFK